jgi:hypothetical protein
LPRARPPWLISRQIPLVQGEGPGDRNDDAALRRPPGERGEHVVAKRRVLAEAAADAERRGGGEVRDGEDATRVAAGDPDQVGQDAARRRGVEDQVGRAADNAPDPLDHPVAVRSHRRSEFL